VSEMKIGFSMHPNWVSGSGLLTFADPLRMGGLTGFEFELDDHLQRWDDFAPLIAEAVNQNFDLSFHAPYRSPHNLSGFSSGRRNEIEMDYCPLLDIAADWAQWTGRQKIVVIHAATGPAEADRKSLEDDTIGFLEFALKAYPDLLFALENNHPALKNSLKIGVRREDVLHFVERIAHPHLQVCWDMGHDYLSGSTDMPGASWLAHVAHVHLHDVDTDGVDHYPLIYGNVPYRPWLQALKKAGMKGMIVLELKGDLMSGWPLERIQAVLDESIREIAREIK